MLSLGSGSVVIGSKVTTESLAEFIGESTVSTYCGQ